jgi:integrase
VAGGPARRRAVAEAAGKALQVLSQVLVSAVEGGRLVRNAASGVRPPKVQHKEMHFLDAHQVEALAEAIDLRYRALVLFAAYTGLRPCELVALRMSRLDLLRCTARVVEAAVEVSRLEWGPVKTHEARTVRMPRSVAEEVGAALAARPQDQGALVFTAPMGGPLGRADFVRSHFKPAVRRANEALAKLPKDQRPAPLPEGLRFYDLRHTCASLLIAQGASVKAVQALLGHYAGDRCQEAASSRRVRRPSKTFCRPTWPLAAASSRWRSRVGLNSIVVWKNVQDSQMDSK